MALNPNILKKNSKDIRCLLTAVGYVKEFKRIQAQELGGEIPTPNFP